MTDWKSFTPEQRADLIRAEIEAGAKSARDISERLGVTRNSVIGICTRREIKLPGDQGLAAVNANRVRKRTIPANPKGQVKTLPRAERSPEPEPIIGGVSFIENTGCKWPLWNRLPAFMVDAKCCGSPAADGSPYCHAHKARSERRAA